ncbi:FAD dependent oxidoreductase [Pedobacter sp. ok626]|uniref:FAD-dependent oxidoreductase n=1 Tax=Pedobacter sp. ok626 TaxID=1761882 RepID=UPI00088E8A08|nr:FAD-dependent oxidoreductase [Pedobacter sp. ok626]SDL87613.1 FAD dependent oxidoreductase [Pedobacter sp. ok626]
MKLMMNSIFFKRLLILSIIFFSNIQFSNAQKAESYTVDVCIYGGNSAGVIAAYSAKKLGKTVLLIEPGKNLGGLTSGGLGFTDIGNKNVVSGLSKDFYRRIGSHYGKLEQWIFEPHVAENIFKDYVNRAGVNVVYNYRLSGLTKVNNVIKSITIEPSAGASKLKHKVVNAKVFIDCSYEGDLMAKAKVSYTVGREANSKYKEIYNGVQLLDGHQFPDQIDPYRIKGDSTSGLIWGVSKNRLMPQGSGDHKVQSYNYRICLTDDPNNRIDIQKPKGYDSTQFELLLRLMEKQKKKVKLDDYFIWSRMPNRKTDINNRNGFSTDMIGLNFAYPDGNYAVRKKYIEDLTLYTQGLLYFFGHDKRVPLELRNEMLQWGYPKDEFKGNNNWSHQPYIREARRMVGAYVVSQADCLGESVADDGIALAAYNMDSHNTDRMVVNHMVKNEGNVEIPGLSPYPISYRALIPKEEECSNLIVPVCLSASHIAYGSIRMEPVFMVLGQVAAVAATLAVDQKVAVQHVNYRKINERLKKDPLLDGSYPELIVDNLSKDIKTEGEWGLKKGRSYGPNALYHNQKSEAAASVTFYGNNLKAGQYELFSYHPIVNNGAATTEVQVFDGADHHKYTIVKADINVLGQTSGEWVSLGKYTFKGTGKAFVKIIGNKTGGVVVADAILFKPLKVGK